MNKPFWSRIFPHALAIVIFLLVTVFFCLPAFKGLIIYQYDMLGTLGGQQQSIEFKEKYGHFPLWTNSVFSGMPAYQIAIEGKYAFSLGILHNVLTLFLPAPANLFFLSCICFYILCMALRMRSWIAIIGSLAYAFCSYNAILMETGHITKLAAMAYAPALIAGIVLLAQRRYFLGFAITLLFGSLMANQNHVQILYYTFLIIGCMGVAFAVHTIRQKQIKHLLISSSLAAVAIGMGLITFSVILLPMNEFAKETMRGGRSELTLGQDVKNVAENKSKGGLDKDYAFSWSYGIGETTTLLVPASRGGGSGMSELKEENHAVEALQGSQLPQDVANFIYQRLTTYWGDQPFTSGPVYIGAVICVLFIIGLFVVRSWHLGWIVTASIVGIVLAWGHHFSSINYFLFDYLPYYNKFRAPAMALVIPQLTFPLLACLALEKLCYGQWEKAVMMKKLKMAGIALVAVVLLVVADYFNADYKSANDKNLSQVLIQMMSQGGQPTDQMVQQANSIAGPINNGLAADRKGLYSSDLTRSIIFILLTAGIVWLVVQKTVKPLYATIGLAILTLIDLIPVDRRYLNDEKYTDKESYLSHFTPTPADLQIKQDTGYFRVLDQARPALNDDARSSYFHNSIGGYNPAKLALYDDLLNHQIRAGNMKVVNMLNTKYFIVSNPADGKPVAQVNPGALGPAWLVKQIRYVNNANEEMNGLTTFEPQDTVLIDKREQSKVPFAPQFDSTASIRLIKNQNDVITYQFKAATNQFAVFSEVYYPYGWKAFIDGKETPIVRVNYTLRGLPVPAGNHTIVFRFEPATYEKANTIALITTIVSVLALVFCGFMAYKRKEFGNLAGETA